MLSYVKNRKAQNADDFETWIETEVAPTLNVFDNGGDVRATVLVFPIQDGRDMQKSQNGLGVGTSDDPAYTLDTTGAQSVATESVVRRLTPRECERLQGFPDDWTASQSDSQRFKQMGNAVTVNVIEWIGKRLMEANNG